MLKIESLDFAYGAANSPTLQSKLFDQLSLAVTAGEHIVIVGDSGSGKSTLLELIAEQADTSSSAISIVDGGRSAMVLQQGALLDHLSVIDNLKLVARYTGIKGNKADQPISGVLEQLNIGKALHKSPISQLSGGQMRRVAIARALLIQPEVLLFDEPDAGLDIVNLSSLANTVNSQIKDSLCAITVSHNPFYMAQIANKVYRLVAGKLVLIADWPELPDSPEQIQQRQLKLQADLSTTLDISKSTATRAAPRDWILLRWLAGSVRALKSVFHRPRSIIDELHIAAYTYYLSCITGLLFFALVGIMLGSTTIAVVKLLADNALSGFVGLFLKPKMLLDMMGGIYVLYLAPAIGGMLFAARSGSIISNWLGEMERAKQIKALRYLNLPVAQYITAPSLIALFVAMLTTIVWFAASVWLGGTIAANLLFEINDASSIMAINVLDIKQSLFWQKNLIYSAIVAITVIALGTSNKSTAHQVNIHTTKAIIYSTLSIAFAELVIILT